VVEQSLASAVDWARHDRGQIMPPKKPSQPVQKRQDISPFLDPNFWANYVEPWYELSTGGGNVLATVCSYYHGNPTFSALGFVAHFEEPTGTKGLRGILKKPLGDLRFNYTSISLTIEKMSDGAVTIVVAVPGADIAYYAPQGKQFPGEAGLSWITCLDGVTWNSAIVSLMQGPP
jgi:hypothetical protein